MGRRSSRAPSRREFAANRQASTFYACGRPELNAADAMISQEQRERLALDRTAH
jgi:hypothetical protein